MPPRKHKVLLVVLMGLALLPDADVLVYMLARPLGMTPHRGITHGLPFVALVATLVAMASSRYFGASRGRLFVASSCALLSHLALDFLMGAGPRLPLFAPYSDAGFLSRVSFVPQAFYATTAEGWLRVLTSPATLLGGEGRLMLAHVSVLAGFVVAAAVAEPSAPAAASVWQMVWGSEEFTGLVDRKQLPEGLPSTILPAEGGEFYVTSTSNKMEGEAKPDAIGTWLARFARDGSLVWWRSPHWDFSTFSPGVVTRTADDGVVSVGKSNGSSCGFDDDGLIVYRDDKAGNKTVERSVLARDGRARVAQAVPIEEVGVEPHRALDGRRPPAPRLRQGLQRLVHRRVDREDRRAGQHGQGA